MPYERHDGPMIPGRGAPSNGGPASSPMRVGSDGCPRIAADLASDRRLPFDGQGIFRRCHEFDPA
ncbi:MAG: hypothetical protein PGN25_02680 [Methylorubrum populi]